MNNLRQRLESQAFADLGAMMEGYAKAAVTNMGLLERGVLFLPKPFRIESLAHILRSALDAE